MKALLPLSLLFLSTQFVHAVIDVSAPTGLTTGDTQWFDLTLNSSNASDYPSDEQATDDRSDIVGDSENPAFYSAFWDGGTDSAINATDGEMAFRVRMGGNEQNKNNFGAVLFIGLNVVDPITGAAANQSLDLFIGLNDKNGEQTIGFYVPDGQAQTGPSTTGISNIINNGSITPVDFSVQTTFASWDIVNNTIDPTNTSLNVDGGSAKGQTDPTDHFLSFKFDFNQLVLAFALQGIAITDESAFTYVLATATQDNSLNQDLNGINGLGGAGTWEDVGGSTNPYSPGEENPVPEPSTYAFIFGFIALGFAASRRRK